MNDKEHNYFIVKLIKDNKEEHIYHIHGKNLKTKDIFLQREYKIRKNIEKVIIGEGCEILEVNLFANFINLRKVELPSTLKIIGGSCFFCCTNLQEIKLPYGIKEINPYSFCYCSNLKNIYFPSSLEYIGHSSFSNCYSLTNVELPLNIGVNENYVSVLREKTFHKCISLKKIVIPSNIKQIMEKCFEDCEKLEKVIINSRDYLIVNSTSFNGCELLSEKSKKDINKLNKRGLVMGFGETLMESY